MSEELDIERTSPWLQKIMNAVAKAETMVIPEWAKGDEFPHWVRHLMGEFLKLAFPTIKIQAKPFWTPGEVGAILGQRFAYIHWMFDGEPFDSFEFEVGVIRQRWNKDDPVNERVIEFIRIFRGEVEPKLTKALKNALSASVDAPYHENVRFIQAYARAVARRPIDDNASDIRTTSATRVYFVLLICWRSVEKISSVAELHRLLCRAMGGERLVGELKSFQRLCERIGLKLRDRGRPTKLKLNTTSLP